MKIAGSLNMILLTILSCFLQNPVNTLETLLPYLSIVTNGKLFFDNGIQTSPLVEIFLIFDYFGLNVPL